MLKKNRKINKMKFNIREKLFSQDYIYLYKAKIIYIL